VNPPKRSTLNVLADPKAAAGPEILQPAGWPMPKGYANGMAADGRLVLTGGVIGWDTKGVLSDDFIAQVRQTLDNISAILAEGGARRDRGHRRYSALNRVRLQLALARSSSSGEFR